MEDAEKFYGGLYGSNSNKLDVIKQKVSVLDSLLKENDMINKKYDGNVEKLAGSCATATFYISQRLEYLDLSSYWVAYDVAYNILGIPITGDRCRLLRSDSQYSFAKSGEYKVTYYDTGTTKGISNIMGFGEEVPVYQLIENPSEFEGDVNRYYSNINLCADKYEKIKEGLGGNQTSAEGGYTFSDLSQYSFSYLNGMCVWNTELEINADGSFTGGYYDEGYTGEVRDYPSEDVTTNSFKGQFTPLKKVNDYTYSTKVKTLMFDNVVGSKKTENGIRYTYDGARGADSGDEFLLYLQSAPASEVPLHLISNNTGRAFCFLYNVTADCWFVGYGK